MGKGMYEVDELLWKKYPKTAVIGIGPAGEMKLSNAGISVNDMENKPGRYAGRGGLGAVMASRGVKAMVVDDRGGPGVEIANQDLFKQGRRKLTESIQEHALTKKGGGLNAFGTAILINILNEAGGLPTRNFSSGQFEGAAKISGEAHRRSDREALHRRQGRRHNRSRLPSRLHHQVLEHLPG